MHGQLVSLPTPQHLISTAKSSLHTRSELNHYVFCESSIKGYVKTCNILFRRLRSQGYPSEFLYKCFEKITYDMCKEHVNKSFNHCRNKNRSSPIMLKLIYSNYTKKLLLRNLFFTLYKRLQEDSSKTNGLLG